MSECRAMAVNPELEAERRLWAEREPWIVAPAGLALLAQDLGDAPEQLAGAGPAGQQDPAEDVRAFARAARSAGNPALGREAWRAMGDAVRRARTAGLAPGRWDLSLSVIGDGRAETAQTR